MTPDEAEKIILETRDDFLIGSVIAHLAALTPGVLYRAQSKLEIAKRLVSDHHVDDKDLSRLNAGVSAMLVACYGLMEKEGFPGQWGATSNTMIGADEDAEEMSADIGIHSVEISLPENLLPAMKRLEQEPPEVLQKILGRLVDKTSYIEVINPKGLPGSRVSHAMMAVRPLIPESANIRLGGMIFTPDNPSVGVLVRANIFRQQKPDLKAEDDTPQP